KSCAFDVALGAEHSALITADRKLLTFGNSANGRLGHGTKGKDAASYQPKPVAELPQANVKVVQASCGQSHSACIDENGVNHCDATWPPLTLYSLPITYCTYLADFGL
ncbi:unnamed protein product, partial [Chrysoparadoxa australica]